MGSPITDKQIKTAIANKIIQIVGSDGTENTPKVYRWNVLKPMGLEDKDKAKVLSEWAGIFTYTPIIDTDPDIVYGAPLVHGWMVKRVDRPYQLSNSDCATYQPAYDVWGLYGFRKGTETSNSEDEFNLIGDNISDSFIGGLLDIEGYSAAHDGLQIIIESTLRSGDKPMHFKGMRIEFNFGD